MVLTNTVAIMKRLSRATMKSDRSPEEIEFIASVASVPVPLIKDAADVSFRFFGLDAAKESREKILLFREVERTEKFDGVEWHLTGRLHGNDLGDAVELFDLIHTVDSADLAEEVNGEAGRLGKVQRILFQVDSTDDLSDATRAGLLAALEKIMELKHLRLEGLMTRVPFFEDIEKGRPRYRRLFSLRVEAEKRGLVLPHLSMGGNHDFEVAIEEGATLVQIGQALFGESCF